VKNISWLMVYATGIFSLRLWSFVALNLKRKISR